MRFHETDRLGDPGFELSLDEVVTRFWQSDDAEAWSKEPLEHLDRVSSRWIFHKLGSCDRETLDECLDAIYEGRPKT